MELKDLEPHPQNPRKISDEKLKMLRKSLEAFGDLGCIVYNKRTGHLIGGHQRLKVLPPEAVITEGVRYSDATKTGTTMEGYVELGGDRFKYREVDVDEPTEKAMNIAANQHGGEFDMAILPDWLNELESFNIDMDLLGFDTTELDDIMAPTAGQAANNLAETFGAPPFSVLDSRQGYWNDRKREWMSMGIDSGKGRGENLMKAGDVPDTAVTSFDKMAQTTSVFDPVLCELMYRWFTPKESVILDPFSGGSVRGIVAAMLNRMYVGVDLRPEQVRENEQQASRVCKGVMPRWVTGDSTNLNNLVGDLRCDFVFTCPPYFDLETYSDLKEDLSNQTWEEFASNYQKIIKLSCDRLKDNRFAAFVIGDIRDKEGNYRNFVSLTIDGFLKAGLKLYNEAVLINAFGTAGLRAGRTFTSGRKLIKCHQNVLVFLKGDAKLATSYCGNVDMAIDQLIVDAAIDASE